MSWEKNSKKKPMIANKFYFLVNFIRRTGPMITMVTRYTGGLFQLLLVKMSWEKNSMEKLMIENNYHFLPKFIAPPPKFCQFLHVLFSDTPPPSPLYGQIPKKSFG